MDGNKAFALSKNYTDKVSTEIKTIINEKLPALSEDTSVEMSLDDIKNVWDSIFN